MIVSKEKVLLELTNTMKELFEIAEEEICLDSRLYEDLDLDSIDAVDLVVHLQSLTGKKFNVEEFQSVRVVADVVDIIYKELNSGA